MRKLQFNINQFKEYLKTKKCICFGAGLQGMNAIYILENWDMSDRLKFFIDNNSSRWGSKYNVEKHSYDIFSIDEARNLIDNDTVIFITCQDVVGVIEQLNHIEEFNNVPCVSLTSLGQQQMLISSYDSIIKTSDTPLIPKIIHYCWFGGEMPKLMQDNVEKWRRMCSDYEIKLWNEDNYDVTKCAYMYEAYRHKAWGFVPDYIRLDIIRQYGGIYLDTDVEILKKPDALLYQESFGISDASFFMNLGAGFGSIPNNPLIKEFLDVYEHENFVLPDGRINNAPCIFYQYRVLRKYGIKLDDSLQSVKGFNIYPMIMASTVPRSMQMRLSDMAYFAHYGTMTWMNSEHLNRRKAVREHKIDGLVEYSL